MCNRTVLGLVVASLLTFGIVGCQTDKTPPSGTIADDLITGTAKVEALDLNTRHIVLRRPDGSMLRFRVGDEVRNLSQVKVGDEVKVSYYASLAWEVKRAGEATPGAQLSGTAERSQPGAKPGGKVEQSLTVTSTISAIDKNAKTVTLRSASGESTTFTARDPKNLDRVSVGDLVQITYTEGVAVSVTPVAK